MTDRNKMVATCIVLSASGVLLLLILLAFCWNMFRKLSKDPRDTEAQRFSEDKLHAINKKWEKYCNVNMERKICQGLLPLVPQKSLRVSALQGCKFPIKGRVTFQEEQHIITNPEFTVEMLKHSEMECKGTQPVRSILKAPSESKIGKREGDIYVQVTNEMSFG